MLQVGALVAVVEKIPVGGRDLTSAQHAKHYAGLKHAAALLADFLALVLGQRRQEIIEIGEPGGILGMPVVPVELHLVAQQQAGRACGGQLVVGREQQVQRRQAAFTRPVQQGPQQRRPRCVALGQQAASGHGREGHGHHGLRVVGQAMALMGVGPGPVEDILAIRMGLDVESAGGAQPLALPQREIARHPARARRGAAAGFECGQIGVAHEGRGLGLERQQGVPGGGVDLAGRIVQPQFVGGRGAGQGQGVGGGGPIMAPKPLARVAWGLRA